MAVDFALVITSIGEPLFQTRPKQGMIGPASLLHSQHRVLFLVNFVFNWFTPKNTLRFKKGFLVAAFFQL